MYPEAYMGKGVVHNALGDITLAWQNLETALRLATEQGKIRNLLKLFNKTFGWFTTPIGTITLTMGNPVD